MKKKYERPTVESSRNPSPEGVETVRGSFEKLLRTDLAVDDKRAVIGIKKRFDKEHPKAAKEEIRRPKNQEIDQRFYDERIIPPEDKARFLTYLEMLPGEKLREKYISRLNQAINARGEAKKVTMLRGAVFEMSRINVLISQGLEQFDFLGDRHGNLKIDYKGYMSAEDDSHIDFSLAPTREIKGSEIEVDVPIIRDGKPYVYEVKAYPRLEYGKGSQAKNQLLKYQKAIEDGLVSGASVEVFGRMDKEFLFWALGERIDDPGHVPDVEIIYTFILPSGKEYRFPLKRPRNNLGLKFENEDHYEESDLRIIRGIQKSLADKEIIRVITEANIDPGSASEELRLLLSNTQEITTLKDFQEFEALRRDAIFKRLLAKEERVNLDNKKSAVSEYANREYIRRLVEEYQDYLNTNPQVAAVKRQYILDRDRSELLDIASDKTEESVLRIREYELARAGSEEERRRRVNRAAMGYKGRPEGISLDIEHVMVDSVYSINKEGMDRSKIVSGIGTEHVDKFFVPTTDNLRLKSKFRTIDDFDRALAEDETLLKAYEQIPKKKRDTLRRLIKEGAFVRSYDWPERFGKIEDLLLTMKDQDRRYMELQTLDSKDRSITRQMGTTEAEIEKTKVALIRENIRRAKDYISGTKRAEQNKRKIDKVLKQIEDVERERDEKIKEPQQQKDFNLVREISSEYQARIAELYELLQVVYKEIIPESEWKTFEKRITAVIDQNIAKFIYVVTPEGEIIVQEEVIRGDVTGRAAHSELARGRNVYGAGELKFEKRDNGWVLVEVNNGSGHYRPDANSNLHYVRNLMQSKGIDVSQAKLVDSLLRGVEVRNRSAF